MRPLTFQRDYQNGMAREWHFLFKCKAISNRHLTHQIFPTRNLIHRYTYTHLFWINLIGCWNHWLWDTIDVNERIYINNIDFLKTQRRLKKKRNICRLRNITSLKTFLFRIWKKIKFLLFLRNSNLSYKATQHQYYEEIVIGIVDMLVGGGGEGWYSMQSVNWFSRNWFLTHNLNHQTIHMEIDLFHRWHSQYKHNTQPYKSPWKEMNEEKITIQHTNETIISTARNDLIAQTDSQSNQPPTWLTLSVK